MRRGRAKGNSNGSMENITSGNGRMGTDMGREYGPISREIVIAGPG